MSLFNNHISPIYAYNFDLLICDCSESVGIVGPKYLHNFFCQLEFPLNLLPHSIENNNLTAVEEDESTSLPVEFSMSFFF